jgi:hypothetical protein
MRILDRRQPIQPLVVSWNKFVYNFFRHELQWMVVMYFFYDCDEKFVDVIGIWINSK